MFRRRRRRRSSFSNPYSPTGGMIAMGLAGAALLAAFVFFFLRADAVAPQPREITIELPNAFD